MGGRALWSPAGFSSYAASKQFAVGDETFRLLYPRTGHLKM